MYKYNEAVFYFEYLRNFTIIYRKFELFS